MKRKYLILGIISAVFLLLTTSCNSNPETFSVAEYGPYHNDGYYYVYVVSSAPREYRQFVNAHVFYPYGNNTVSDGWKTSCKEAIEDALNSYDFYTFTYNGNYYICLNKKVF